jgi:hypothetical protein
MQASAFGKIHLLRKFALIGDIAEYISENQRFADTVVFRKQNLVGLQDFPDCLERVVDQHIHVVV